MLNAFYSLLSRALHQTRNLKSLRLYLLGPCSCILLGCPFRLTKLDISLDWDRDLSRWFLEQSELESIEYDDPLSDDPDHFKLAAGTLPKLRRFSGPIRAGQDLLPSRPIESIVVRFDDPAAIQASAM